MEDNIFQESKRPFITSAWQQHAGLVSHLCQFSQNVLLIVAPQGGGKTTFAAHLHHIAAKELNMNVVRAHSRGTVETLLQSVMEGFKLEYRGVTRAAQQMQNALEEAFRRQEAPWVLLVDDAHLLTSAQLQALLQLVKFEIEPRRQLHIVLLGEPSLELRLFSAEFAPTIQGKIYTIELESWNLCDINAFFEASGKHVLLNSEQVELIFQSSQGLPGRVVQESERLFKKVNIAGIKVIRNYGKGWAMRPMSLIFVGLLMGSTYLLFSNNAEEENSVNIPLNTVQAPKPWPVENTTTDKSPSIAFHFDSKETPIEEEIAPEPRERAMSLAMQVSPVTPASDKPEKVEEKLTLSADDNEAIEINSPENVPVQAPKLMKNRVQAEVKKERSPKETASLAAKKPHYTLQLLGARKEENVKQFIQQHALQGKTTYFRTKRAGEDWYVVVYGNYASPIEAKAAIKTMPTSLKDQRPWVREMGAQQEVRRG